MKDKIKFYSLLDIDENEGKSKWCPISVDVLEDALCGKLIKNSSKETKKNICYSLQYLQYITLQLQELKLTSMLKTLSYKSYIVFGISIIESIFSYILKSNNLYRKTNLEEVETFTCNEKSICGSKEKYKMISTLYKIIDEKYEEMSLDSMIKKIEAHKFFSLSNNIYPYLKGLKRLRNKIHLDAYGNSKNTDWYEFKRTDYLIMKLALRRIFASEEISCKNEEVFKFLKLTEEESRILTETFKKININK